MNNNNNMLIPFFYGNELHSYEKFPRQNILLLKAYFLEVKVKEINTTKPLDLLHMDLMGLIRRVEVVKDMS